MAQERRVAKNLELQNQPGDSAEYLALQDTGNIADRWRLQAENDQASDWQPVEYSRPPKARPGWILPSIVGLVLVAVVGYVAWIGFNSFGSGETAQEPQVTAPADASAGDDTVAQADGTAESPADDTQPGGEQTEAQQTATSEAAAPLATATTPPTPIPSPTVVLVEQQIATITNQYGVNAREEPTLDSEVIRILEQGETAVIIDEQEDETIDGNWLQVRISEGTLAWISSGFVEITTQMVPAEEGGEGVALQPTAEAPAASDTVTDTVPAETPDDAVETPTDVPADLPVSVTISSTFGLNARTAPSSDAEIVATLEDQSTYTATQRSEDGQWVEVTLEDGSEAWVFTEFVATTGDLSTLPIASEEEAAQDAPVASTEPLTETATTTETAPSEVGVTAVVSSTFGANARATADTTANVLRVVPTGNEVIVVGRTEDSEWLQVELDDGRVGWIFTSAVLITAEEVETLPVVEPEPVGDTPDLLSLAPEGATATVVSLIGTNARSTPNTSEPAIQAVPSGSELPVLGRSADNQWVQVVLDDGTEAWIFTNNVELNVDLESLPVTE